MRIRSRITFWCKDIEKARRILEPFGLKPNTKPNVNIHAAEFFVDQKEYGEFLEALARYDIEPKPDELRTMFFDDNELAEAEYLHMAPAGYWGYPKPEDDYLNESYDVSNMCPHCGQGIRQVKPLLVGKPGKFSKRDIAALNWEFEWLVTDRLRNLIEKAGLTGAEFWPLLYSKKRIEIENLSQLKVTNLTPPMSPNAEFEIRERRQMKCGHIPRTFGTHQMKYLRKDLSLFKDFNLTNEHLGGGYFRLKRNTVVSSSVYKMFNQNKIRRVTFDPVIMED